MTPEIISSLLQGGTSGVVIIVVLVFLNFLRDERAARIAESDKRDEEFGKRNDAIIRSLDLQASRSDAICKALEGLTVSIMQHDTRTQPAVNRIMEMERDRDSSKRNRNMQ